MAIAVKGINRIVLMRPLSMRSQAEAMRMAFQTTHDVSSSRGSDSTVTKDGTVVSLGEESVEISLTTLRAQVDDSRDSLKKAYQAGEVIEFWDINKTEAAPTGNENAGKFPATYYQGYLTDWSESAGAEDNVEISLTASINGSGVEGYATLTEDQMVVVQYKFADTTIQTGA